MAIPAAVGMIGSSFIGGLFGRSSARRQARAAAAEAARNRAFLDEKQKQALYGQQIAAGAPWFDITDPNARAEFDQNYAGRSRTMLPWDMNELEGSMKSDMSDGYNAFNEITGGLREMIGAGSEVAQSYSPFMRSAGQALGEIYDGTYENQMRQRSTERQAALDQGNLANQKTLKGLRSGSLASAYRASDPSQGGSTRLTGDMVRASMPYSLKASQAAADTAFRQAQDRAYTDKNILDAKLQNAENIQSLASMEAGLPYLGVGTALSQMDRYINSLSPYRIGTSEASPIISPYTQQTT